MSKTSNIKAARWTDKWNQLNSTAWGYGLYFLLRLNKWALKWLLCVKWLDLFHTYTQYCVSSISDMKNNKRNNFCSGYLTVVEITIPQLLLVKSSWCHSATLSDSSFILGSMKATFSKAFNLESCKLCKWLFAYVNCALAHPKACIITMSWLL